MEQVANGHLLGEPTALQPHQSHFFLLNHHSESAVQTTHATMATGNPMAQSSMPLVRFMPNMLVMNVWNRMIMLSDVRSLMMVF